MCEPPRIYSPPSQNQPPVSTTICDTPRIYPSFPKYTPLFNKCICAILPEPTPLSQNKPPFSTTVCDPPRIYPSLPEYTPPPPFNRYNIMRPTQNLHLPPRIYPPFQLIYMCDHPRIYPVSPRIYPHFNNYV